MPGWILVANRFSLLPTMRKYGGISSVIASLTCLVVASGCSNIRQQSLELPLPILPSETATATGTSGEVPDLPLLASSDPAKSVSSAENSVENGLVLNQAAFKNDFDASEFQQSPSVQSYLPSENDFQLQQPRARFVGLMDKAEMAEIKLMATTDKAAPAPAIAQASHESEIQNCETPEVCDAHEPGQCACCKKKELPKLALVAPVDPEQLPELFGTRRTTNEYKTLAPLQSTLRPLQSTEAASQPIRLTARQDSPTLQSLERSSVAEPAQTQNKAQLLIPIAPAELQAFKADVDQIKTQKTQATAAPQTIRVSPLMDINSALAKASFPTPTKVVSTNLASPQRITVKTADATQSKFIPVSSSGIRVSEVPFRSLPVSLPKPFVGPAKPVATQPMIAKPTPEVVPIKISEPVEIVQLREDPKQYPPVVSNDFSPLLTISARQIGTVAAQTSVTQAAQNEEVKQAEQTFQAPLAFEADIDPLADMNGLPDMAQIEKELAEFEKLNTFDPSTIIESDRIDPSVLLAKLDGPLKKDTIPAPAVEVVQATPNNDLITQQLAAQSSALLELQDAIKQLKSKPVTVSPAAPVLTLSNAAFCTKISGFGQFKPFAANDFSSSQRTLLYCEVENQTSKQFTNIDGSKQYETILHGSIVIYDENDQVVQTAKFPAIKDVARHQRRDFYVYFPVQFDDLARGDYRLELSVEDASVSEPAVLRPFMRFSVR